MLTYLAIIMAMSVTFSAVIYSTSSAHLQRQVVDDSYFSPGGGPFVPTERLMQYRQYIRDSVSAGKRELVLELYVLNLVMLVFGGIFSYLLARWTLEPIERSSRAQTRFVSDASHELRTPLTAIQATNEVALRRKKLTLADAREVIRGNLDDVRRLQRMSTMLLQLATTDQTFDLQPIDVRSIIQRAIDDTSVQAAEKSIVIDNQAREGSVMADPDAAAQAVTILLDNAIKYSPAKSTVTITTTSERRGNVTIAVRDQGPGIDKAEQELVFSRFYRSDRARTSGSGGEKSGYGLGLEIAQNIAHAHGGNIELKSKLGKGSTFSLVLPASKPAR